MRCSMENAPPASSLQSSAPLDLVLVAQYTMPCILSLINLLAGMHPKRQAVPLAAHNGGAVAANLQALSVH